MLNLKKYLLEHKKKNNATKILLSDTKSIEKKIKSYNEI